MSIQLQFEALVSGATSAGTRVYPLTAPDGVTKPYITYQRVAVNSENVLFGDSGLVNTRLQVDMFAKTYGEVDVLAQQLDALMDGWSVQNVSILSQDGYEPDVKVFRVSTDYSIWHPSP